MPDTERFGPSWLARRLAGLTPQYPKVRLCVAFSGGLDSTALLLACAALPGPRPSVRAIHVDHGLRPDARRWSAHCRKLARRLEVPIRTLRAVVERRRGDSLEEAARDARYAALARALAPDELLLTAHTQDDQLETVLLQLLRGSGLPGVAAMPERSAFAAGQLLRPLLDRSRADLEGWVRGQSVEWVEDDSNADERLDRNYLRRRVLPLLRARWKGAATAVARTARHAAEAQRLLEALGRHDSDGASYGEDLWTCALRALPPERRRNALRYWIARAGRPLPDTRRLNEIAGPLLGARGDAQPEVAWKGAMVRRQGDRLVLASAGQGEAAPAAVPWTWRSALRCRLPGGTLELQADPHGTLDLEALPEALTVRWRVGGERLRPQHGGARRSLKSLLQEAHIAVADRRRLPLVYAGEQLLAVAGLWVDAAVQPSPATRMRGRLIWSPEDRSAGAVRTRPRM